MYQKVHFISWTLAGSKSDSIPIDSCVSQLWKEHVDEFIKLNFNTKFIRVATISRLVKITSTIKIVDHKFNSWRLI